MTVQFPDTSVQSIPITAATIEFTSLGTTSADTIAGRLELTFSNGNLSAEFSGQPNFLTAL